MHPVERRQLHADHLSSGGAVAPARSLRTARSMIMLAAAAATALGLVTLIFVHGARLEITLLLGAAAVWLVTLWYVGRRSLDHDLQVARVRLLGARDMERMRIQRDLHDGAQQRLVSVRIHLGLMAASTTSAEERQRLEQLGKELDNALAEIRSVTRAGSPELLARFGVATCLRSAASTSPIPVRIEAVGFGRLDAEVEQAVYYCALEALQNAVKHAGPRAVARIRLRRTADRVSFEVEDSGQGFDPGRVKHGDGLANLADRLAVMHGHLSIDSRPGMGTRIRGEIPLAQAQRR